MPGINSFFQATCGRVPIHCKASNTKVAEPSAQSMFALLEYSLNSSDEGSFFEEEEKKKKNKVSRWQAIAESAAKQSKRSIVPEIQDIISYKNALKMAEELDVILVPYENKDGMKATKEALSGIKSGMSVGIFIGPEGGFDEKEIETAVGMGGKTISLGKRILRTETAAITAVSMCMLYAEMELGEE